MDRVEKGNRIDSHVDDYVVLDLETTGHNVLEDSIIEISAIKVRNNVIVDEFSTLINPEIHIPEMATRVNHITDDMVKDAPTIDKVIDLFLEFVGNDVIVGYNIASFDINLVYDAVQWLRNIPFSNDYLDVLYCAKRVLDGVENHKLETLCKYYEIDNVGEHRALVDCKLTKTVYDRLYSDYGDKIFTNSFVCIPSGNRERFHLSDDTLALRELQTLLDSITEDGRISPDEFSTIRLWTEKHIDLRGNYPFDRVYNALASVLEDGIVTKEELAELQVIFSENINPVKSMDNHCEIESISEKHVVITGDFSFGTREEVIQFIVNKGGIIDSSVKKVTNYVVVGNKGSDRWQTGNFGTKIKKAMEYKEKGIPIEIVEEDDFFKCLQG